MGYGSEAMLVDFANKQISTKLVFFGPAMSGKTTSVKWLFSRFGDEKKLESIETTTGRTLFFDFGYLSLGMGDWDVKANVWTATGQDYYAGTRSTVLAGSDGIILVFDSQREYVKNNIESWNEIRGFFGNKLGNEIPLIICLNKMDIPGVINSDEMKKLLSLDGGTLVYETIATTGQNIVEAFQSLLIQVFRGAH